MLSHAVYSEAATGRGQLTMTAAQWRSTRWALRTGENKLTDDKRALINQIARTNWHIGRAWTLKEQLRDLYRIDHPPGGARRHLRRWITAAKRSRINAFVALAKRLQVYFEQIITANRRHQRQNPAHQCPRYGHHSAQALTSMIYLTCGGLRPKLPTQT